MSILFMYIEMAYVSQMFYYCYSLQVIQIHLLQVRICQNHVEFIMIRLQFETMNAY